MRRRLSTLRFVTILILLSAALSLYSPLRAQETPPPPPPLPETPVVVTVPPEPTATTELLPSETPTLEPTATDVPPTETVEPTAVPPTETPFVEPTLEPTVEATIDASVTPEAEVTSEATAEATLDPSIETATPEMLPTDSPTLAASDSNERRGSGRVESQLLELEALVEEGQTAQAQSFAASMQLEVSANVQTVHVEVVAADAAEALRMRPIVERLGGAFLIGYDRRMEFNFPVMALDTLDRTSGSFGVMRPSEAVPVLGPKLSEGVQVTGAAQWHQRGYNGTGVRVGVIDIGFSGYSGAETTGCVQTISNFAPGETLTSLGDHGANVAQIICDMAPKAQVYLAQVSTLSSLNAAVDWMIAQNVQIVNMSLGWDFAGAGDGTGEVNTIVDRLADGGILLVNAAGNENGAVWHGTYTDTTFANDGTISGTGEFLDFGPGAGTAQAINKLFYGLTLNNFNCNPGQGMALSVTLRWSDWNGNRTGNANNQDFALHVYSSENGTNWNLEGVSDDFQDTFDFVSPIEGLGGIVPCYDFFSGNSLMYGVAVECFANCIIPGAPYMQIIAARGGNLFMQTAGSSLTSPADSEMVMAVAAAEMKPMTGFPFSSLGYPDLAIYSSRGPVLGAGGTDPIAFPPPPNLNKPEVTGPTNATTSLSTSFNGTSAASPHVAGFAALVYQYNRAAFDALAGSARTQALTDDILDPSLFLRSVPATSDRPGCGAANIFCFGGGVITINNDFFAETDALLQHTDGRVLRSGAGWTQQTQSGASGGNYIYTKGQNANTDNFAQIQFGVTHGTGVQVFFWQRPDLNGGLQILQTGVGDVTGLASFSHGNSLNNAMPRLVSFTLNLTPYIGLNEITILPSGAANGLTLDYVQVLHNTPITTFQENLFTAPAAGVRMGVSGTWTRTALANTSGGYHMTNNQRGASVWFQTDEFATDFTVTYTKRPDGGIMEIWVNGQLCTACGEINMWSGSTMTSLQAVHFVDAAALTPFGAERYFVQLVNSGRQTPATTNRPYVTIDNIRFPAGGDIAFIIDGAGRLEAETGYSGQAGSRFLPMNGVWTNMAQASAFGGRVLNTVTPGAEFRFMTGATRLMVYYTGLNTGALLEIYVNGQLCTACGTIDTYRSTTMYKLPYYFEIPGSFASLYHVTLRNTGRRSSGAATVMTATMAIDRIDSIDNLVAGPLDLFNVQGTDTNVVGQGLFSINERWVANRQNDAIGTDVYINNSSVGNIWFNTCSTDFTLLLGKNPNAGIVSVSIWDGASYDLLAEFNGQSTATIWRYGLNVTINPLSYPPCDSNSPYQLLVEVDSVTQFGNTLDYGYIDALLLNDNQPMFGWGATSQETLQFGSSELVEVGAGWATFAQTDALGGDVRRTNVSGRSIQFTLNDPTPLTTPYSPRLIFSRGPDGGIAEVFVNGIFQYEISFYSPVVLPQQFLPLTLPSNIEFPAVVELRNVPRRTTGSTGYYIYVDAVIETQEPTGFVTPIINGVLGTQQNSPNVQLFGATWTNSNASTTMFPSGANIATTTTNSGGVRFILNGSNRFSFVSSTSTNRGIAEIWVNGRLCTGCGTINTFRPQTFWRVPFVVEIPTATFGAGPYYVDIRTTNVRSVGATGFGLSADEIIPLDGGTIVASSDPLWTANIVQEMAGSSYFLPASWTTTSNTASYGGSHRLTTSTAAFVSFELPAANDTLAVLHHRSTRGGIAEIWIFDTAIGDFRLCFECGTINSYSPYTRYQVPYYFQIPASFPPDDNGTPGVPGDDFWQVDIQNTALHSAGSTGYDLALDAFILLP